MFHEKLLCLMCSGIILKKPLSQLLKVSCKNAILDSVRGSLKKIIISLLVTVFTNTIPKMFSCCTH